MCFAWDRLRCDWCHNRCSEISSNHFNSLKITPSANYDARTGNAKMPERRALRTELRFRVGVE